MAEKVTTMELKVDLQCCRCYKKVKKVLCKFPEIRDQKYDEKANTVTITVVSCCPEKIRDKIYCKGGGCIESIEIKPPPSPPKKEPPPKNPPPKSPPPPPPPCLPIGCCCMECYMTYVSWGGYKYCYVSRGDCFSEENPQACSIM